MTTPTTQPEWLTKRHDTNPERWRVSSGAPLFGFASADHLDGQIVAPTNSGPMSEILRTYALVQARYGLTTDSLLEIANDWGTSKKAVELAHVHYLQAVTNKAIGKKPNDWKDGTGTFHADNVTHAKTDSDAFAYALTHIHTAQSNTIGRALSARNRELGETYKTAKKALARLLTNKYEKPATKSTSRMTHTIGELARALDRLLDDADRQKGHGDESNEKPNPYKPEPKTGDDGQWYPVIPAPVHLNRPHLGKIGTRRLATDTGKTVRNPSRALTDPSRRVFSRRTTSKSALVVLDMSGSMGYTTEDLDQLIENVRGAIVVGYSAGDDESPNFYVLAKDGHRVNEIPDVCGGNGNDGPAFTHAVKKYRKTPTTPVVWVSDGAITGRGDYSTRDLARDMVRRLQSANATHVQDIGEALDIFSDLTRGKKPGHRISPYLRALAGR